MKINIKIKFNYIIDKKNKNSDIIKLINELELKQINADNSLYNIYQTKTMRHNKINLLKNIYCNDDMCFTMDKVYFLLYGLKIVSNQKMVKQGVGRGRGYSEVLKRTSFYNGNNRKLMNISFNLLDNLKFILQALKSLKACNSLDFYSYFIVVSSLENFLISFISNFESVCIDDGFLFNTHKLKNLESFNTFDYFNESDIYDRLNELGNKKSKKYYYLGKEFNEKPTEEEMNEVNEKVKRLIIKIYKYGYGIMGYDKKETRFNYIMSSIYISIALFTKHLSYNRFDEINNLNSEKCLINLDSNIKLNKMLSNKNSIPLSIMTLNSKVLNKVNDIINNTELLYENQLEGFYSKCDISIFNFTENFYEKDAFFYIYKFIRNNKQYLYNKEDNRLNKSFTNWIYSYDLVSNLSFYMQQYSLYLNDEAMINLINTVLKNGTRIVDSRIIELIFTDNEIKSKILDLILYNNLNQNTIEALNYFSKEDLKERIYLFFKKLFITRMESMTNFLSEKKLDIIKKDIDKFDYVKKND